MAQAATSKKDEKPTFAPHSKGSKLSPEGFSPEYIRNICILAHVDHGKTCIADCLLTLNGLVKKHSAGKTKYLDDRPDEQDRQITMKSSAVTIGFYLDEPEVFKKVPMLINLIDTPGHVDFSTEIVSATRISDGALIVVDVVEGVSPQTRVAIKYAYEEKLEMILILNKFDRLILDLHLNAIEMFLKLLCIIEQCNLYIASLAEFEIQRVSAITHNIQRVQRNKANNYFNPVRGNVIFACAIDGWGFTLRRIANMYINMIQGETLTSLTEKLWEMDLYVSSKDKRIRSGAVEKGIPNVFSQLICSMLTHIYTTLAIRQDEGGVHRIVTKLGIDVSKLSLRFYGCKMKLKLIMEEWSSLAQTIAKQCFHRIPSPAKANNDRTNFLMNLDRYFFYSVSNERLLHSITSFRECCAKGSPIAYITKLIIDTKNSGPILAKQASPDEKIPLDLDLIIKKLRNMSVDEGRVRILGLVRIYSGTLYPGQKLTVINHDHNLIEYLVPDEPSFELYTKPQELTIEKIFLSLGPEYMEVKSLGAGYICAISCKETFPFSSATLCDSFCTPPIIKQTKMEPIVYNVITPENPGDSQLLRTGLQMLQQFDSCFRTFINESGEYVVSTAGRVHLEKCLMDLKKKFVDIEIVVSPPIYSLRETVDQTLMLPVCKSIELPSSCKIYIELAVVTLPNNIAAVLQNYHAILDMIQNQEVPSIGDICCRIQKDQLRMSKDKTFNLDFQSKVIDKLQVLINKAIRENDTTVWNAIDMVNTRSSIMRISTSPENINIMINDITTYVCSLFCTTTEYDLRVFIFNYLVNAFNLACEMGPICKEPVSNCAFILNELDVSGPIHALVAKDPLIGNHITQQLKQVFLEAIERDNYAVMEPVLEAAIQTDIRWLGGICSEVHRCFGQVLLYEDVDEDSQFINVRACVPATDGEDFVLGIRKATAGTAAVFMNFSHYQLIAGDPEEEEDKNKKKGKLNSRADYLVKIVRARKGITIHDQVVPYAEKQRTLKK